MSLILQFCGDTLGAPVTFNVARSATPPDVLETWRVELDIEAATPAALEPLLQAVRDLHGTSGELKLRNNDIDVRVLNPTDCRHGPKLHQITELDRAPGEAHNRRRVTLEFRATLQDAGSAIQSHEFTVRTIVEPGHAARLITAGKAVLRAGENPAGLESLVLPVLGSGLRRAKQVVARDSTLPSLEYEVTDELVFTPLPAGVEDGHYVTSEFVDDNGRSLRAVSGFFVGVSAKAKALELRPMERLVSSRVAENPFNRRVDFEFIELAETSSTLALTETLTFTTMRRVIDHPLLDTALAAYRQQVGSPQTEVVQEGSAIGDGRHVSPPAPRYSADLLERRVHYSMPHAGLPADRRWVTNWRYVSRGRAAIFASAPEAQ